jgi:putative Ca2+/H+ antiporter (TMEM165/GDT1 family)
VNRTWRLWPGALLALWTVAALAVLGGRGLLRLIDVATVRKMTAAVLLILGLATAVSALA